MGNELLFGHLCVQFAIIDSTGTTAIVLCNIRTNLLPSCCTTALYDATTTIFEHNPTVFDNTDYSPSAT